MPVAKYKKCPRCELNYIAKNEDYCGVCKAELKLAPALFIDESDDEELDGTLCPICKINYITFEESVCAVCREKTEKEESFDEEDEEVWRSYLDDEKEEVLPIMDNIEVSLSELEEEELEEDEIDSFESDADDFDSIEDYDDEDDLEEDIDDEDDEE